MHARLSPGTRLATIALWPLRTLRGGVPHSITTLEIVLGGFGLVAALLAAALLSPALGALPGVAAASSLPSRWRWCWPPSGSGSP